MLLVHGGKWPSKASEVYGAGRSGETPQLENPGGARVSSGSPCYQEENRAKHAIVSRLPFRFTKSFEESAVQPSSMLHASFHPHIQLVQLTSLLFNVQLETWGFRAFK